MKTVVTLLCTLAPESTSEFLSCHHATEEKCSLSILLSQYLRISSHEHCNVIDDDIMIHAISTTEAIVWLGSETLATLLVKRGKVEICDESLKSIALVSFAYGESVMSQYIEIEFLPSLPIDPNDCNTVIALF